MGSRRGPSRRSDIEEGDWGGTSEVADDLQLLPAVNTRGRRHGTEDYPGHRKWQTRRVLAVHPALTDYGPQTMQIYLENELAKMRDRAMRAVIHIQQDQDLQLRQFARDLVNAQTNIYPAKEDGKRTFEISKMKGQQQRPSSDKGKAVVRDIPQNDGLGMLDVLTASSTSRNVNECVFSPSAVRPSDPHAASDRSHNRIPRSKPLRLGGFDRPKHNANHKSNTASPLRRSPRSKAATKGVADQKLLPNDSLHRDTDMLEPAAIGQGDEADAALYSATMADASSESQVLLARSTSFENHASSSRTSRRPKDTSLNFGSQSHYDSHRRRKTPAIVHVDQNTRDASARLRRSSVLSQQMHPLDVMSSSPTLYLSAGAAINYHANTEPPRADPPASEHPFDSQTSASEYNHPHQAATADKMVTDEGDCYELENGSQMVEDMPAQQLKEQHAIWASIVGDKTRPGHSRPDSFSQCPIHFDYAQIVPEQMPPDIRQAEVNRCKIWEAHGLDDRGKVIAAKSNSGHFGPFTDVQLDPERENFLCCPNDLGDYPRKFLRPASFFNPRQPPFCPSTHPKISLPTEFWEVGVLHYLSSAEVRSLRLVCKILAQELEPYIFRSVVAKFGPSLFSINPSYNADGKLNLTSGDSMLKRHGPTMNKFGLTFDVDLHGLMHAPFKNTEKTVDAWFGRYTWPITDYPYFPALRAIDKLLDDERRLMTQAMSNLGKCSELAISVDSGHGWLEGPDMSDLAIYRRCTSGGDRIFGKAFGAVDRGHEDGMKQLFTWAQMNTINESIKYLDDDLSKVREELDVLRRIIIREYDSYRQEKAQPDYARDIHTGGLVTSSTGAQGQNAVAGNAAHPVAQQINQLTQQMGAMPPAQNANHQVFQQRFASVMNLVRSHLPSSDTQSKTIEQKRERVLPQWPIIFNGYNLSAESRGHRSCVQGRVATPADFPLLPAALTEAQAQWLMETSWIQRTFLSAYTDAVRVNSSVLKNVHSLHVAKLSSGLLPALSQKAFWAALPGLRKVTLLIKPDWRVEHIPGDKYFQTTMSTDPVNAAYKFSELLRDFVVPLENLNSLHVGYVGGGEHQTGMFGRNQHVLPAPVTSNPRDWLVAQNLSQAKPNANTLFTFPHIRTLTFENCWFSPHMLETFMRKSRDNSLHNLVLSSVSLTAQVNSTRVDGPLRTVENDLKCQHTPSAWLNETMPANASWVSTLDKITPGLTILDKKYDAGMINEKVSPRPERQFRGNVRQITLSSCGYVKILGIPSNDFNQNELVFQNSSWSAMDEGLKVRSCKFTKIIPHDVPSRPADDGQQNDSFTAHPRRASACVATSGSSEAAASRPERVQQKESQTTSPTSSRFIMLAGRQGHHVRGDSVSLVEGRSLTALTGFLTQCIHPVEKRILERMWGMEFGWGDDMKRWEAVEDGWFIGGTGRFSGHVFRDPEQQEAVALPLEEQDDQTSSGQSGSLSTHFDTYNAHTPYDLTNAASSAAAHGAGPLGIPAQDTDGDQYVGEDAECIHESEGHEVDDFHDENNAVYGTEYFARTTED